MHCWRSGLGVALLALSYTAASGSVIRVPQDESTIQAGIDAASPGDTVLVSQGTYTGPGNRNIAFGASPVVLRSVSGPQLTTIDGQAAGQIMYFGAGVESTCVVSGFTLRGGKSTSGGAVLCEEASPKFVDCVFDDNRALKHGGAVACHEGDTIFEACVFTGNRAFDYDIYCRGGAISTDSGSVRIRGCLFQGNTATTGGALSSRNRCRPRLINSRFEDNADAVRMWDCRPYFAGCVFAGNSGLAMELENCSGTVTQCEFVGNTGPSTAGLALTGFADCFPSVSYCVFINNAATGEYSAGGAMHCGVPHARVSFCDFTGNSATAGGAIFLYGSNATLTNCTLYDNEAAFGSAVFASWAGGVTIRNTIMAFNGPGEAVLDYDDVLSFECTDIYGNDGGDWVGSIAPQLGVSGNLSEDPLFCAMPGPGAVPELEAGSPCASEAQPDCGLIGAHDIGCSTLVWPATWGAIKARYR